MPANSNARVGSRAPQRSTATSTGEVSHASKPGATKAKLTRRQAATVKLKHRYHAIELKTGSPAPLIARHEAAHAVAALAVGLPWHHIEMLPAPWLSWEGHQAVYDARPASAALVALAGIASDDHCETLGEHAKVNPAGNLPDLWLANHHIARLLGYTYADGKLQLDLEQSERFNAHFACLGGLASRLVVEWWARIEELGLALYATGRVERSQVNYDDSLYCDEATLLETIAAQLPGVRAAIAHGTPPDPGSQIYRLTHLSARVGERYEPGAIAGLIGGAS